MTADQPSGEADGSKSSYGDRLEKWARDSAALQPGARAGSVPALPEDAALSGYLTSRTKAVALPHPAVSPARYEDLSGQRNSAIARLSLALLAIPVLVVLGLLVGPVAVKVALLALTLPVGAYAVLQGRRLSGLEAQRHLKIRGGLADAWADWRDAHRRLDALGSPAQARAALAANDARMQSLILALAKADAVAGHQDSTEQAASRVWVYESAAKAKALAGAEEALATATQRHLDHQELHLAPDGDAESLDHALDTARALNRLEGPDALPPAE